MIKKMKTIPLGWPLGILAGALSMALLPQVSRAQIAVSELDPKAPTSYTVVKGDTLWHISNKFLKSPGNWPKLWGMNRETIKNPHLIYPGNLLQMDIVNGMATLRVGSTTNADIVLKPGIRFEDAADEAVPTIPLESLRQFLSRPLVVDVEQFNASPRILGSDSGKIFAGAGYSVYADGLDPAATGSFSVYRQGAPLRDPETGATLAYEAIYLGAVEVRRADKTSLLSVVSANQEITKGDRIVPLSSGVLTNPVIQNVPHGFAARVIKVQDGRSSSLLADLGMDLREYDKEGGPLSVVILNKGRSEGLLEGHVMQLRYAGATIGRKSLSGFDDGSKAKDPVSLPDEDNGTVVVFKSFDKVAYALVMSAKRQVRAGDSAVAP